MAVMVVKNTNNTQYVITELASDYEGERVLPLIWPR